MVSRKTNEIISYIDNYFTNILNIQGKDIALYKKPPLAPLIENIKKFSDLELEVGEIEQDGGSNKATEEKACNCGTLFSYICRL